MKLPRRWVKDVEYDARRGKLTVISSDEVAGNPVWLHRLGCAIPLAFSGRIYIAGKVGYGSRIPFGVTNTFIAQAPHLTAAKMESALAGLSVNLFDGLVPDPTRPFVYLLFTTEAVTLYQDYILEAFNTLCGDSRCRIRKISLHDTETYGYHCLGLYIQADWSAVRQQETLLQDILQF